MKSHIKRFLLYIRSERGYGPHTVKAYRTDLNEFSHYFVLMTAINEYL